MGGGKPTDNYVILTSKKRHSVSSLSDSDEFIVLNDEVNPQNLQLSEAEVDEEGIPTEAGVAHEEVAQAPLPTVVDENLNFEGDAEVLVEPTKTENVTGSMENDDWVSDEINSSTENEKSVMVDPDFLLLGGKQTTQKSETGSRQPNAENRTEVPSSFAEMNPELMQSTHKGLTNKTGENNCFLNGVLQILWHNKNFRKCLLSIQNHQCQDASESPEGACVYCKLKNLFLEYQFSDSAQIPPNALRKTLSIIYKPESRFQLNSMDDAAECLEAILQRLHHDFLLDQKTSSSLCGHQPGSAIHTIFRESSICNPSCVAHNIFGMNILEQSVCSCGSTSEPLCYSTFLQYYNVKELINMATSMTKPLPQGWEKKQTSSGQIYFVDHNSKKSTWVAPPGCNLGESPDYSFSFLLHTVAISSLVSCPNNLCKKKNPNFKTPLNIPKVVSLGLNWTSSSDPRADITDIFKLIQPYIDLRRMFNSSAVGIDDSHLMSLRGLVCYYGRHYVAFSFSVSFQTWLMFDDASVIQVGPNFEDVALKCQRSAYQPSLLFYESS